MEEIILENFNISENNIISVELAKVLGYPQSKPLFTLSFSRYPLCFHPPDPSLTGWNPQSNEILLNLSVKCSNSAFNVQGSRIIIVDVHVGVVKNIWSSGGGAEEKGKTG